MASSVEHRKNKVKQRRKRLERDAAPRFYYTWLIELGRCSLETSGHLDDYRQRYGRYGSALFLHQIVYSGG